MRKVRYRTITILAIAAIFLLTLGAAFLLHAPRTSSAGAVSYTPSSVFSAGTGGEVGESGGENKSVQFTLNDGGSVYFRRDLAIKWFEQAPEGSTTEDPLQSALKNPGAAKYFTMAFAFPEVRFTEFKIVFESAEENVSKDAKATNEIVFTKQNNELSVTLHDASYEEGDTTENKPLTYTNGEAISVSLADSSNDVGNFAVSLKVGEGEPVALGDFTNIGGNYFEYRSSASTTPATPMTFTAELPEGSEPQQVVMQELNGQTFGLNGEGRVEDNAAPVLALNEKIYSFRLGQRFSLTYEAIDVCDDSVSVTRTYYMAKQDADKHWLKPKTENSDYASLTTSTFFMPTSEEGEEAAYVSIRFELDDGRDADDYFVYLTWYAADASVVTKLGEGEEEYDYINVDLEAEGPEYTVLEANRAKDAPAAEHTNVPTGDYERLVGLYGENLTDAASKVSAGDGAYLYLPSLRGLISSDFADYRNLRFNVYYFKPGQTEDDSASSETSLRYNNLRIEVDEVGEYRMRIIAQDASGNAMKYYNKDGDLVTLSADNVWDVENIPEFRFNIGYTGPVIEDAGEQSLGYRDNTYTVSSFDIVALEGYKTEYSLYRINESELPEGENLPAYATLVKEAETWANKFIAWDAAKPEGEPKIFAEIAKYNSDITEEDDEWSRTDNAYEWDPESSLSFRPQERGIYFVKVVVIDSYLPDKTETAYQVIEVRNPIDTIPGQSQWLQDNIVAVVLFSVSGVLLIVIIVLAVVKPSEKRVEEVDLEKLKGNAKSKNKPKKK